MEGLDWLFSMYSRQDKITVGVYGSLYTLHHQHLPIYQSLSQSSNAANQQKDVSRLNSTRPALPLRCGGAGDNDMSERALRSARDLLPNIWRHAPALTCFPTRHINSVSIATPAVKIGDNACLGPCGRLVRRHQPVAATRPAKSPEPARIP